jgi:hypothetical protein
MYITRALTINALTHNELGEHGDECAVDLTGRRQNVLNLENMEMNARLILSGIIEMY